MIKRIKNKIKKIIKNLEDKPIDLKNWLVAFFSIVAVRIFVEAVVLGFPKRSLEEFLFLFIHAFLFFLLVYLVFLVFLSKALRLETRKIANVLLWGFWIIILPPIIDGVVFFEKGFKSFYIFDGLAGLVKRFFLFFGENPDWGITLGTRVEVFLVLVLLFFYAFFKKKNILKSLLVVLVGYAIFFIFGVLPSIVGIVLGVFAEGGVMMVREFDIAALFMSPYEFFGIKGKEITSFLPRKMSAIYLLLIFASIAVFQYRNSKQKFFALLKNTRPLQAVYNLGLLFIGLGLGLFNYGENFQLDFFSILTLLNLMLVVFSAWYFSVFVNDYFDCQIDKISNKERPLVSGVFSKKEFVDISLVFLLLSLVAALVINPLFFWLVLFYHVLTWIYSAPPFRLKRFFVFSNLIIAAASVLFIFIGFLVFSGEELFKAFPWSLAGFFFLAYFFILPIKDFKDIKGDKKNGVYTLPVLIGEELARLFLASALFVFYFLSVYIVNEPGMFLPALVFGSASFFVVASKKTETRKMGSRVFALVFLYGLLSVWIIFS